MASIDLVNDEELINELKYKQEVCRSLRVERGLPQKRAAIVCVHVTENSAITYTNNPLNDTN
jgi:hypothetical protein